MSAINTIIIIFMLSSYMINVSGAQKKDADCSDTMGCITDIKVQYANLIK